MKKIWKIVGIVFGVILIIVMGLYFYFFYIPPLPPNVITSLPPTPVPGADDAYWDYEKMVALFPGEPTEPELKKLLDGDLNPTSKDIPAIKSLIKKYKPCLDEFELGSQKKVCTIPAIYLPKGSFTYSLFTIYMENFIQWDYKPYRITADTLLLQGKLAELENRPEEAIDDYLTIIKVGKHLDQTALMIRMVGAALRGLGSMAMYNLLSEPNSVFVSSTAFEKMQHVEPTLSMDLNNLALYEPNFRIKDIVGINNAARMILQKIMNIPNFNKAINQYKIVNIRQELAYLASAIRVYQSKNQKTPEKLENLVPDPLTTLPKDPFTSTNFNYFSQGTEVVLYSFGPDTTDNHAQFLYDPTNGTMSTGDIVIKLTVN